MNPGDEVRLRNDPGRQGILTGRSRAVGDRISQQVRFADGNVQYVPEDQLELVEGAEVPADLLRRGRLARPIDLYETLAQIRLSGKLANLIYSLETTGTDFYAHQFKPVLKLLNSANNGILIADEVGLGKTIEAGLIWTELRTRFDYQRLVVVCPAVLRDKWCRELRVRFGVPAEGMDSAELYAALRQIEEGERQELAAVVSLQGTRPPKHWEFKEEEGSARLKLAKLLSRRAEDDPLIDLCVIDEAHYLRNPETQTAELGALVRSVSAYLILLSATPIHLRSEDLFFLLRLIDEDTFSHPDVFEQIIRANEPLIRARDGIAYGKLSPEAILEELVKASRHPLLHGNRQLQQLIDSPPRAVDLATPREVAALAQRVETINLVGHAVTRTRKRDVQERVVRDPVVYPVPMTEEERTFYDNITNSVREYCDREGQPEGFLLVTPQRQIASCMAAALGSWSQTGHNIADQLAEDLDEQVLEDDDVDVGPLVSHLRDVAPTFAKFRDLRAGDSKYGELLRVLREILQKSPGEKVVVFSYFRATLDYLRERLREDGIRAIVLKGRGRSGVKFEESDWEPETIVASFKASGGPSVLLSSEVGSEGIDLQFSSVLVNYDLPWNPMKVEQRIGRLDRIGQLAEKIRIINLIYADTIDERIYKRLYLRLSIFERALGGLEAILGPVIRELTKELLASILSPEQQVARIEQAALALEQRRSEEERLEGEAASLVAYGDYILSQVYAAKELSRRVTAEDIERHVIGFFGRFYAGCQFHEMPETERTYEVTLSVEAKNDFARFLRNRRAEGQTRLVRNDPEPVLCVFENQAGNGRLRGGERISQFHPLLKFIASELEQRRALRTPAIAAKLSVTSAPPGVSVGDYCFAVTRSTCTALRTVEKLWFGVECVGSSPIQLDVETSERLIHAVAREGRDWPAAPAEIDPGAIATQLEQGLLDRAEDQFQREVEEFRAQNADRADFQRRSLESHLARQRQRYQEIRDRHVAHNRVGLARAEETKMAKLEERIRRELAGINSRSEPRVSKDEICVGVVRVMATA